jgi:formylmethanofuran dehydrogenase subunit B
MSAFVAGDIVRVIDHQGFMSAFSKKIADRDAVVVWVGPNSMGQFKHQMKVRFLKRNGRGSEFEEIMSIRDFSKVAP